MNPDNTDPTNTPPAETPATETLSTEAPVAETPASQFAPNPTPESTAPVTTSSTPIVEAAPAPAGAPSPKNANTKKIVLIASIAAGVLLLAAIAAIVFSMMNTVSKEDYRDAAKQFNEVSRASSKLTSEVATLGRSTSSSTSDSEFEGSLKDAKDAISKLKAENDELSKLKAVRVSEGKELYGTFNDKLAAYTSYADGLLASVEGLRPVKIVCEKTGDTTDAAARTQALKDCSAAFGKMEKLPNESFNVFAGKLKEAYATYATAFEKSSALTNPYGAQYDEYKKYRDSMREAQTTISQASRDFSKSIGESDDKYSVRESANALGDYLTEQQRK